MAYRLQSGRQPGYPSGLDQYRYLGLGRHQPTRRPSAGSDFHFGDLGSSRDPGGSDLGPKNPIDRTERPRGQGKIGDFSA